MRVYSRSAVPLPAPAKPIRRTHAAGFPDPSTPFMSFMVSAAFKVTAPARFTACDREMFHHACGSRSFLSSYWGEGTGVDDYGGHGLLAFL